MPLLKFMCPEADPDRMRIIHDIGVFIDGALLAKGVLMGEQHFVDEAQSNCDYMGCTYLMRCRCGAQFRMQDAERP